MVFINDIEEELGMIAGDKNKPYAALVHIASDGFSITGGLEAKIRNMYSCSGKHSGKG